VTTQQAPQRIALTIAGSDSGGGAGIQADLKTFQALGVYGMSAITAVTAQNTLTVNAVVEMPAEIVAEQIDAVVFDIGVDAVKTGMLASIPLIETVADRIKNWGLQHSLVVDPVMVSKSGHRLLAEDAVQSLIQHIIPLAAVLTPNLPEAEVLVGRRLANDNDIRYAARQIVDMGARSVVMKGGHRFGAVDEDVVDVFFDGESFLELRSERIQTRNTHGTGCTFSAAITAGLAKRLPATEAVRQAKLYLAEAIRQATDLGDGHGPVKHDWLLTRAPL
jgi:hydroxymethylpyrimidine/phosphomethylpyrimidine kinase